jgi:5'(3')-deoxyribonucleotidase
MRVEYGLKSKLKTLKQGVLAFCTDTNQLYVGTTTGNKIIGGISSIIVNGTTYNPDVEGIINLGNITPVNTEPTAPVIALDSTGDTTATISLTTASTDVEDGVIANYNVYTDGILHVSNIALVEAGTYQLTGLDNGTTYAITLKAKDSGNVLSVASNSVSATTTVPVSNTAPTAPVIAQSSIGETSITINLTTASTDTEDGTVTKYNVYKNGSLHASNVTLAQGETYQLTGLTTETQYAIGIKAKDNVGALSDMSNVLTITTFAHINIIPTAPVISLVETLSTAAKIKLVTASVDEEEGILTKYNVYKDGVLFAQDVTLAVNGTYQLTELATGVSCAITLKGKDSADALSSASNIINATPNYVLAQNFNVANQTDWGSDFTSYKYGNYDTPTVADIYNNQGLLSVKSIAVGGGGNGINMVSAPKLDLTGNKKYRISFKGQTKTPSSVALQVLGVELMTGTDYSGYTNATGGVLVGNSLGLTHLDNGNFHVRKIINETINSTRYVGTTGFDTTNVILDTSIQHSVVMEISTSTLKITLDGTTYVNIADDLSNLNNANVNLNFFVYGGNGDTAIRQSAVDDILVERIA